MLCDCHKKPSPQIQNPWSYKYTSRNPVVTELFPWRRIIVRISVVCVPLAPVRMEALYVVVLPSPKAAAPQLGAPWCWCWRRSVGRCLLAGVCEALPKYAHVLPVTWLGENTEEVRAMLLTRQHTNPQKGNLGFVWQDIRRRMDLLICCPWT